MKLLCIPDDPERTAVAPLAGAWIEINKPAFDFDEDAGRSPRGSVD